MPRGGARPGAGKKKGSISKKVKERMIAFEEIRNRVIRSKDALINAQMGLAKGLTFLYVIKTVKGKRMKPRIIKDQATIELFLADELENNNEEYYFMATERPSNMALDSLLDRTFDKSVQRTEINNPDGNLKTIIFEKHAGNSQS